MKYLVVVLLVLAAKLVQNCPDRWALSNVDVWAHRNTRGFGQHNKSININLLDNYQMIEITKANVSVLCEGMIRNFPHLTYLTLIEANISKILPGAFQQLPNITHLSLALNHLTSIERYQFQNLETLTVLYLSSNEIENVEEDAFADLVNIRKIYLDRNRILEINSKWFLEFAYVSLIDISFNGVSKVQKAAFTLPKNSMVEIRLQHNIIEEIEPGAVDTPATDEEVPYLTLHLDHNNLTTITPEFLESMDRFHSTVIFNSNDITCLPSKTIEILKVVTVNLNLLDNPLQCECLDAITGFEKDHVLRSTIYYNSKLECSLHGVKPPDNWNTAPQKL